MRALLFLGAALAMIVVACGFAFAGDSLTAFLCVPFVLSLACASASAYLWESSRD